METVFRIENHLGHGPYWECSVLKNIGEEIGCDFYWSADHPAADDDIELKDKWYPFVKGKNNWVFGFESIYKYFNWVYAAVARSMLDERGFVLAEYRVPKQHVLHGDKQSIFFKDMAVLINKHSCSLTIPISVPSLHFTIGESTNDATISGWSISRTN